MDLAEAHIATLDYLLKNDPKYLTFNIGTGIGYKCFRDNKYV